jgi:aarF domain-containing kinase
LIQIPHQTDPNWSNFLFGLSNSSAKPQLILLDFGATRSYGKAFIDKYMRIIRAAYEGDREEVNRKITIKPNQ